MRVAGIIAEYNPLHNGHVHHIAQTREKTGSEYVIVAMSGDYVQRGEPAIADKFARAEWALHAGADLVLELPVTCAVSSAERFAYGGVRVLAGTGVVNVLSFGSENADIALIKKAADVLAHETPQFKSRLQGQLAVGKSYPRARYDALEESGAPRFVLDLLRTPNSILGLEYIRCLNKYAPDVEPVAIARKGSHYHDTALGGAYASATAIREALFRNDSAVEGTMPMYVAGRFALGARPIMPGDAEQLMLYALKRMRPDEYLELPDVQEGFENVIARAARKAITLSQLFETLKSKRYTMARCKRIALCAMLGVTKGDVSAVLDEQALYLRVLGFRNAARPLLTAINAAKTLPLVARHADLARCTPEALEQLAIDRRAHSIYALISAPENPPEDFSRPPIII